MMALLSFFADKYYTVRAVLAKKQKMSMPENAHDSAAV